MSITFIRTEKKSCPNPQCDTKREEKRRRKGKWMEQAGIWLVYAIGMTMVLLQLRSLI
ncbi:MAG: hypothetical protein K2O78_04645 [Muribaculaceae bacterium]|nr:hypothetical protein [Muribaculaceae bacterium]MDE7080924.1 hypothetical protein [Muribaculaceae bacterium]